MDILCNKKDSAIRKEHNNPRVTNRGGGASYRRLFQDEQQMTKPVDVAIIGAGPYGLSIGAHLRKLGIAFRIFGSPMHSWRERMPASMLLKSEGFATNLYDP